MAMVALRYILNGGPVQVLPAGCSVAIHRESVVDFDRGRAAGWARYGLTGSVYKFVPANGVWTLVQDMAGGVADNSIAAAANPVPAN